MTVRILVADDSRTMRQILAMTFAGEDAEVVVVDSAQAALAKAREFRPHLVLADASMPGTDGYALCQALKSTPALSEAAVIVLASQHAPFDAGRGQACGADGHLDKPFDTQAALDKTSQVLRGERARATAAAQPAPPQAAPPARPPAPPPRAAEPRPAPPAAARPAAGNRTVMGIGSPTGGRPASPVAAAAPPARQPAPSRPTASAATAPQRPAAPTGSVTSNGAGAALVQRLEGLGLNATQVDGVLALSREVIEQVVWEVVPTLAETMIREEIQRLTTDDAG